jgi:hypothetical protein
VSQVLIIILRIGDKVDDQKKDSGTVSKQTFRSEKLKTGNRGLKSDPTGRSPWRRRRCAFDCSGIEEEGDDKKVAELVLRRKCEQSGLTILTLKECVLSNYAFVVKLSRNNDNISYYFLCIYGGNISNKIPLLLVPDVLIIITHNHSFYYSQLSLLTTINGNDFFPFSFFSLSFLLSWVYLCVIALYCVPL